MGRRSSRAAPTGLIVLALCAASQLGCLGVRSPSESDSGEMIQRSAEFRRPKYAHIPRQVFIPDHWSLRQHGQMSVTQLARFEPTLAILKLQKSVQIVDQLYPDPKYDFDLHWSHVLTVAPAGTVDTTLLMTDTREEFEADRRWVRELLDVVESQQTLHLRNVRLVPAWRFPIGKRVFERVEGVHRPEEKTVDLGPNEIAVDFTWKWHADSAGDAFDSESDTYLVLPDSVQYAARDAGVRMNTVDPMLSRAILRHTGGQWALRTIQWSVGRGNPP